MKIKELMLVVLTHIATAAIALVVLTYGVGEPDYAFIVAAGVGAFSGAHRYHGHHQDKAPFNVKATLGLVMSILCAIEMIALLSVWTYTRYPTVTIPITVLGTFGFPFVLFETIRKSMKRPGMKL